MKKYIIILKNIIHYHQNLFDVPIIIKFVKNYHSKTIS